MEELAVRQVKLPSARFTHPLPTSPFTRRGSPRPPLVDSLDTFFLPAHLRYGHRQHCSDGAVSLASHFALPPHASRSAAASLRGFDLPLAARQLPPSSRYHGFSLRQPNARNSDRQVRLPQSNLGFALKNVVVCFVWVRPRLRSPAHDSSYGPAYELYERGLSILLLLGYQSALSKALLSALVTLTGHTRR